LNFIKGIFIVGEIFCSLGGGTLSKLKV